MHKTLAGPFEKLQETKTTLFSTVRHLSDHEINEKPEVGKWSIGQTLFHMHLAEYNGLAYMKKKTGDPSALHKSGLKQAWRVFLLKIFLYLPLKFKAPRVVSEGIPEQVNIAALEAEWANTHLALKEFLEAVPEHWLNLNIFRHPYIGMINIRQAMSFYQSHFNHHLPQVRRLMGKLSTK